MSGETAVAVRAPINAGASPLAIVPRNMDELGRMAVMLSKSGLVPKGLNNVEAVATAVMMGLEVGLSPMQSIQNIAVINGRPSVWGDAALGLVRASGLLDDFHEEPILDANNTVIGYRCQAKRHGSPRVIEHTFTVIQAKRARLLAKPGPWQEYPERMLQMRARAFVLRDGFADVLRGLHVREEVSDIIDVTPTMLSDAAPGEPATARMLEPPAESDPLMAVATAGQKPTTELSDELAAKFEAEVALPQGEIPISEPTEKPPTEKPPPKKGEIEHVCPNCQSTDVTSGKKAFSYVCKDCGSTFED